MADLFTSITFDEETHTYQYNNKRVDISVTGLIHQFSQEFDEETMAERVANKRGVSVEQILDEWHTRRDYSCVKGNEIHKFAQGLWKHEEYNTDYTTIETRFVEQLKTDLEILKPQAIAFYEEYHEMLELVKDEQYIYDEDYDIAGSIDLLCKNKYTDRYVIVDFKSNDNFYKKAYGDMKVPLHELEDSNLSHYSLQLEIYKQIFEKNTSEKVEDTFIVYFNLEADNFEIIEPINVKKEVKKILEMRRKNRMGKCIPILIVGRSGSGKSTSLRNLKKEDYSLINPLSKRLPFKGGQTGLESSDYELIKKFIAETPKGIVVLDDSNYLLTMELMKKAKETGYNKFTDIAVNYWKLIEFIKSLDGDKRVYLLSHEEVDEFGNIGVKTVGKMLTNQCCIEGLYTIVLRAENENGKFTFRTKTAGNDIVKTPIGMFEDELIDNDLVLVDKAICEYYEIENKKEEEKK